MIKEIGPGPSLSSWLGLSPSLSLPSILLPLLLTVSLFIGPLYVHFLRARMHDAGGVVHSSKGWWRWQWNEEQRWMTMRNIIAAPIFEEWFFRGVILCLLISGGWSFGWCVILGPALFGAAHIHHLCHHVTSKGCSFKTAVLIVAFQLLYTSLFAAYASFIFLRCGSLIAAVAAHAFCNTMGVPDLSPLFAPTQLYDQRAKLKIIMAYVIGIVAFAIGLFPLTDPTWNNSNSNPSIASSGSASSRGFQYPPNWLLHYHDMRDQVAKYMS